ncbi:MAG: DUF805 domain-containing protein [Planctomycetaceae bacterium]|jgi:uncharacterized membrane protein YhaH (DUF805 family)|nr:DUF805 domain-containing protein [Planctomycetaceae bacterium]
MSYYIQIRNKAFGPFDTEQLLEMKDNGKLGRSTHISENKIDWFAAENLEFLFPVSIPTTQSNHDSLRNSRDTKTETTIPEPANWFYSQNGENGYGPVTVSTINQMIKSGTLNAESMAWQEGQFARKLNELPQFLEQFNTIQRYSAQSSNGETSLITDTFCSACGSQLLPNSNVCQNCGCHVKNQRKKINSDGLGDKFDSNGIGYADVLKKYADFSGRARRSEYWRFTIYNTVILPLFLASLGIIIIFLMNLSSAKIETKFIVIGVLAAVYLLYNLLIFLPSLAVCVRRLHDTGNSGWMVLITLIPIVGLIILLVLLVQDSQPGNNQHGQNPKYGY